MGLNVAISSNPLFLSCVQEPGAAPSACAGGTTSRARSARSGSAPASRPSGSVTETTTAGTTATRTDAVSSH